MPRTPTNDIPLKSCLFGTVKLLRNAIKSTFIYNGRGIEFDGEGSWSFSNDVPRKVVIFAVDNSSLSHNDNRKSTFLLLGEGPINGIHNSTGTSEISLEWTLIKQRKNFA